MISLIAASAFMLSTVKQEQQPQIVNPTPCIIVTGSAEARVAPDLATLSVGVTSEGKTAQEAQEDANRKASDFLEKVKKLLDSKGTVQTGQLNLYPVYNQQNMPSDQPFVPKIVAYRAENTLSVRTTDFTLVGPVIDTAVAAGLNNIQSVSFGLQDDTSARMQALSDAVKQARRKAEIMASAAGVGLGGIWEISEQGARVMPFQAESMMAGRAAASTPTPVEVGDVVVSGDVTIKFFIK